MSDLRAMSLMSLRVSTASEATVVDPEGDPDPKSDPALKPDSSLSASPPPRRRIVTGLKGKARIKVVQPFNLQL